MRLYAVDRGQPDEARIAEAADILRAGGLVVFPTETVYGLGADGLNPVAIRRVYEVKQRPPLRPLTLMIAARETVAELAVDVPPEAWAVMEAFWPGPLTVVLWKSERVPPETVGGGDRVGLRFPAHPVPCALIRQAGVPLAAPSANRSGRPAPATAQAAQAELGEAVDLYLDAGPADSGVASTVLDLTVRPARLLRRGEVSREALAAVLGEGVEEEP